MPLYDYLCDACGHRFEEVFSIHDDSARAWCPNCQSFIREPLPVETLPNGAMSLQLTPDLLAATPRGRKIITQFPGVTHGMVREAHYNTTVGKVVTSDADFKNELSRMSDEVSERNQIPAKFAAIDHREAREHLGVTEEGMDSTYAHRRAVEAQ